MTGKQNWGHGGPEDMSKKELNRRFRDIVEQIDISDAPGMGVQMGKKAPSPGAMAMRGPRDYSLEEERFTPPRPQGKISLSLPVIIFIAMWAMVIITATIFFFMGRTMPAFLGGVLIVIALATPIPLTIALRSRRR